MAKRGPALIASKKPRSPGKGAQSDIKLGHSKNGKGLVETSTAATGEYGIEETTDVDGNIIRQPSDTKTEERKIRSDFLDSEQHIRIVDLLCEGPIEGIVDGRKGIFLENTPLQSDDDKPNFKGVKIETRKGTLTQSRLTLVNGIEQEISVGVEVTRDNSVVRTITDVNVDAVRVTIGVPQLQAVTDSGKFEGESFELGISVQYNDGKGWRDEMERRVKGRTGELYQTAFRVELKRGAAFPVDIRVRRLSPDSSNNKRQNKFVWTSYTEITYEKLRYPRSALVGLQFSAEQFSSEPERMYRIRGRKIRLPTNATVSTSGRVTYAGIWDGTFTADTDADRVWCRDPAWILWDVLTSSAGLGDHINAAQLDKFAFYSASQYCNELIPDSRGNLEQRFACNVYIQSLEEAYTLINNLAGVFRAMPHWGSGALTISQDRPQSQVYTFNRSNVGPDGFNYSSSSIKSRPTVVVVKYLDLDALDANYVEVEDADKVARYGVVKADLEGFATTSRSQAERIGEWMLYAEWNGEGVDFTTGLHAGSIVRPGSVVAISDPLKTGERRGGRVTAATTTAITVDSAEGITGSGGTLTIMAADGTLTSRAVSAISGHVFTCAAFPAAPDAGSVWVYENASAVTSLWRVLSVVEQDRAEYKITAVSYNPSSYDYIERNRALVDRDITILNELLVPPTNLRGDSSLYVEAGQVYSRIVLAWEPPGGVQEYVVAWQRDNDNWVTETVQRTDYIITDAATGTYTIQVRSKRGFQTSEPALLIYQERGKTAAPADVQGLTLTPVNDVTATLRWTPSTDLDVQIGGRLLIRHQAVSSGAVWDQGVELVPPVGGNQTEKLVPLLAGTVMVKWEDSTGNRSVNAASAVVTLPVVQPRLAVQTIEEHPANFVGTATNMVYDSARDSLILSGGGSFDALTANIDSYAVNWDSLTSATEMATSGSYSFATTFTAAPAVFEFNVRRLLTVVPYLNNSPTFDNRPGNVDSWTTWDGAAGSLDRADAQVWVRATPDNPSGSPVWGPWQLLTSNLVRARGLQFELRATTADPGQNIQVLTLAAAIELQQRTERSDLITSGAATYNVTFANAFYQAPSIGITASNMATGDYFAVASVTRTGFSVTFRNSAGTAVSRTFYYRAEGFGREV